MGSGSPDVRLISCQKEHTLQVTSPRQTEIRLSLFATDGSLIFAMPRHSVAAGRSQLSLGTGPLARGAYFASIEADGLVQVKKLIVQ
jgi:hypothetical protein